MQIRRKERKVETTRLCSPEEKIKEKHFQLLTKNKNKKKRKIKKFLFQAAEECSFKRFNILNVTFS